MRRRSRFLAPVLLAMIALAALAPGAQAISVRYPTLSLGNRGSDVRALQTTLLGRGYALAFDGIFGTTTRAAVKAFQSTHGLTATGIADDLTWNRVLTQIGPGSTGTPVKVLQRELIEKRHAKVPVDGVYGASTKAAVVAFQKHMGLTANGIAGLQTWRWLLWHYELPVFNTTTLCDYSVGNGAANWATGASIGALEAAAATVAPVGFGRIAVGDASFEHGGNIPGHVTHEVGLDIDVRLMRRDKNQCRYPTNYHLSSYDRNATRALIRAIRAAAPGHVKLIYFNDPVLIAQGLTTHYAGHDDHLHIRYCVPGYTDPMYRC